MAWLTHTGVVEDLVHTHTSLVLSTACTNTVVNLHITLRSRKASIADAGKGRLTVDTRSTITARCDTLTVVCTVWSGVALSADAGVIGGQTNTLTISPTIHAIAEIDNLPTQGPCEASTANTPKGGLYVEALAAILTRIAPTMVYVKAVRAGESWLAHTRVVICHTHLVGAADNTNTVAVSFTKDVAVLAVVIRSAHRREGHLETSISEYPVVGASGHCSPDFDAQSVNKCGTRCRKDLHVKLNRL